MTRRENTALGYKIDYAKQRIVMNYKFAKNAEAYNSEEYKLLKQITMDFPDMTTIVRSGRVCKECNVFKGLTYEHMKKHMNAYRNNDELLDRFEMVVELSKPVASPYKYVRDWFELQFPNYKNVSVTAERALSPIKLIELADPNNYPQKFEA